ncbi:MAG: hypothetical protein GY811_25825 [Myxococcales bacterium]|nr:hypothetical protein [Myxococcales bacterium]
MGKRLGLALVLLAAVFGVGFLLYAKLFSAQRPSQAAKALGASTDAAAPMPMVPDASVAAPRAIVGAIAGTLERQANDGTWQPLAVGDAVNPNDVLRTTGDNAPATLHLGSNGTTIELKGELTVPTITTELSTVEVVDGSVAAHVPSDGDSTLRVAARGSDAVAETKDGDFSMLSTGTGKVAVASRRGRVAVSAAGETVLVGAGSQTLVSGKGPPSPPEKLPASLLLKVGKTARVLRMRETVVRGTTTPGAIVSVGGVRVQADSNGEFRTKVALKEGHNRLKLIVEDAMGRRLGRDLPSFVVDSKPPNTKTGVEW